MNLRAYSYDNMEILHYIDDIILLEEGWNTYNVPVLNSNKVNCITLEELKSKYQLKFLYNINIKQ